MADPVAEINPAKKKVIDLYLFPKKHKKLPTPKNTIPNNQTVSLKFCQRADNNKVGQAY